MQCVLPKKISDLIFVEFSFHVQKHPYAKFSANERSIATIFMLSQPFLNLHDLAGVLSLYCKGVRDFVRILERACNEQCKCIHPYGSSCFP